MEDKLSIKINIVGKTYNLKIGYDEEETIRKAAKMVNDKLASYKQTYGENESSDFVAMTALHFATKYVESNTDEQLGEVLEEIRQINVDLDEYIYQNKSKS